ncbi:2-isopropylmalate synthase [candidate division KSB3 bacterium]|uniref:2-isopropylmalate synthase n=1 Tax=candidate division KSB3 bacterium TaxID=2044937 RepID=A0A9D5Q5Y8_9BACT|nr:2-isopropylmalate synthase [candidate division KSB3 bacterium]MBD3324853.1 2-isopropylmalate synthase [candidate division KSB3 bacterium]
MKRMNFEKYQPYPVIDLPDRQWPSKTITRAPIWCSVDLRDGNQALRIPMNLDEKLRLFDLLVDVGFKEIEIGFPSASQVEYDFTRILIEENRIPEDVTVQVLTQARGHLIRKTYEALEGVHKAIVHFYNSTSTLQRDVVFRMNKAEIKAIAVEGAKLIKALKEEVGNPGIRFEYSPESFTGTELDYALDVCHGVMEVFEPTPDNRLILNLPATVEMSTPNVHADQIEWFCRHLNNRDSAIISLHTHNDRGTAVAAAELAVMAGADRVEGTLFGNGERTGNMDIVTMALNIFSQGVDPKLDLTNINRVRDVYQACTRMNVHERHPYVGELVYTAFSGSHQDAINKGMKAQESRDSGIWDVPYLAIDPQDVGRTYQSIIRINSQSGKGGVAYIMEREFGFKLPKSMHPEFGRLIQHLTDQSGDELPPQEIWKCFDQEYLQRSHPYQLRECHIHMDATDNDAEGTLVNAVVGLNGDEIAFEAKGNGPIDAFVKGLNHHANLQFTLQSYSEHDIDHRSDSRAVAYISIKKQSGRSGFGVGIDSNISVASIKAILSALNRLAA